MKSIGVREAKTKLSQLLREVRQGQEWLITDHGLPVARLAPVAIEQLTLQEQLRRLEAAGKIEPLKRKPAKIPEPQVLEPAGLAQQWLQEDRDR